MFARGRARDRRLKRGVYILRHTEKRYGARDGVKAQAPLSVLSVSLPLGPGVIVNYVRQRGTSLDYRAERVSSKRFAK